MTAAKKKTLTRRLVVWGTGLAILALIAVSLVPKPQPADFATSERGPLRVTLDEEAADLIRFQQAYQAIAQVISVADSTFQTLLSAVGR